MLPTTPSSTRVAKKNFLHLWWFCSGSVHDDSDATKPCCCRRISTKILAIELKEANSSSKPYILLSRAGLSRQIPPTSPINKDAPAIVDGCIWQEWVGSTSLPDTESSSASWLNRILVSFKVHPLVYFYQHFQMGIGNAFCQEVSHSSS